MLNPPIGDSYRWECTMSHLTNACQLIKIKIPKLHSRLNTFLCPDLLVAYC